MSRAQTLSAVSFLLNCGCGDSNCSSCYMFFPKANCGDDSCSSCVCVIPTSASSAIVLIAADDTLLAFETNAGRIVNAAVVKP